MGPGIRRDDEALWARRKSAFACPTYWHDMLNPHIADQENGFMKLTKLRK